MSRSNPISDAVNPATRWFEWAGAEDKGFVRWYDKDAKTEVKVEFPFTFLLLDELSTIKGWHEPSESGIYANEVRDTRQEVLVVRSFKGDELANGVYKDIKDRIVATGGQYAASLYIAYKDGDTLKIGNLTLKGAAAGMWMQFKRETPPAKDVNGKTIKGYFGGAIKITGFNDAKKGRNNYRIPVFKLIEVNPETNKQAIALDAELQTFLAEYLKRPKAEAATPQHDGERIPPDDDISHPGKRIYRDDFEDDIPFILNDCLFDVGNKLSRRLGRDRKTLFQMRNE